MLPRVVFSTYLLFALFEITSASRSESLAGMDFTLRYATADDVEAITQIELATNPQMNVFKYLFPYSDEYPQDTYKYTRIGIQKFVDNSIENWDYATVVAEAKLDSSPNTTIVAFTVWEVSALQPRQARQEVPKDQHVLKDSEVPTAQPNSAATATRRDEDPVHSKLYSEIINNARRTYLEPTDVENGPLSYLHMTRLATLPKYQRHGLGTALTNWGLEICQQRNISAGLFSTSIAKQLYDHLGFKLLKDIVVQVPGEEEKVVMACMKWDPVA